MPVVEPEDGRENILIVKLGAFGNIVLSMGAFAAIRAHHAQARITILTSPAYADWLRTFPYFDAVLADPRPSWWNLAARHHFRRTLTGTRYSRAYDLQTSPRSSRYFFMFPAKHRPAWSGIAFGCALPDRDPKRNTLHDALRIEGQLRQAGITSFPPPDLSWCTENGRLDLASDFALLVPGSSPHRLAKRWPAERYQALAKALRCRGVTPVIIGSRSEASIAAQISAAIDLTGQTNFGDIADLARKANFAIGNDTGPMHLIATAGCPTVTLFSGDSDPARCAPVGPLTRVLRRDDLSQLSVEAVLAELPETAIV